MTNQNDYIILFDENGDPYIAHGWIKDTYNKVTSNFKNSDGTWKHHKYIAKLKNTFGKWIYFYSNEALQAYQKSQQESVQAQRDLALTQRTVAEQRAGHTSRYNRKEANAAIERAQENVAEKAKAVAEAKEAYEQTWRGRKEKKKEEKAEAKRQEEETKRKSATDKYYEARKKDGYDDAAYSLWDKNRKKNSAYSDEALEKVARKGMKKDKVQTYDGDNPELQKAYQEVLSRRMRAEAHFLDVPYAQKELEQAQETYNRAIEGYREVWAESTSSKEAKLAAGHMADQAAKNLKTAKKNLQTLEKLINEDRKDYRSAIQIYNMQRHLLGL